MRIRGVGVIDDAVLDLSPGLNVLTGETGAGKTMVVSGLGLLLGERADSGLVRTGCRPGPRRGRRPAAAGASGARPRRRGRRRPRGRRARHRPHHRRGRTVAGPRRRSHCPGRGARRARAACSSPSTARRTSGGSSRATRTGRSSTTSADQALTRAARPRREPPRRVARAAPASTNASSSEARERAREIDSLTASLEEIEAVDPQPGEDAALRAEDERLAHADTPPTGGRPGARRPQR